MAENQQRVNNFLWAGGSFLKCSKENQDCPGTDIIHDGPLIAREIEAVGHDASSVITFVNAVQVAMGCVRVVGPTYAAYQDPTPGDLEPEQLWPAAKVAVQRLAMVLSVTQGDDQTKAQASPAPTMGLLSISDLQELFSLNKAEKDALAKQLERWRPKHVDDWFEDQNAGAHKARYMYRLEAIRPRIKKMIGSERVGQTSFDK